MSGHVFLDPLDVGRLREEMTLQGAVLPRLEPGTHITVTEIDAALESIAPEPIALADRKLWADWVGFLEGASVNGGLVVQ
jgi:hypothetical protein